MRADIVRVRETHLSGFIGLDLKDLGYEWYGFNRTHIYKDAHFRKLPELNFIIEYEIS